MPSRFANWQTQAKFGTVVLLVALTWGTLNPGLELSQAFVAAAYFLLGLLAAAAFPGRIAIAAILPLAGALLPEVLQSLVPYRDTREIELLVKWLVTTAGFISGLLLVYLIDRSGRAT